MWLETRVRWDAALRRTKVLVSADNGDDDGVEDCLDLKD